MSRVTGNSIIPLSRGFPCGSAGGESACNVGDLGSISGLGRSPGVGKGYPLQYSGLENSKECVVHGVAKSRTQMSDFHFHFEGQRNKAEIIQLVNIISEVKVAQSCLTLCDPMDCSPPGSSVHGISQVKRCHLNHPDKVKRIGKCCHPVLTHRYKYKCLLKYCSLFTAT